MLERHRGPIIKGLLCFKLVSELYTVSSGMLLKIFDVSGIQI